MKFLKTEDGIRRAMLMYAITDRQCFGDRIPESAVMAAILGGATCIQLREKDLPEATFVEEARRIKAVCDRYDVPLIINDSLTVALAVDAAGLHIGQSDGSVAEMRSRLGADKVLGVTARTMDQAVCAEADGADYIGSGAIFGTSTKPEAERLSVEGLKRITRSVSIPVVAIGGIDAGNAMTLAGTGIAGLAAASGIFGCSDIEAATRRLVAISREVASSSVRKPHGMPTALTVAGSDSSGGAGIQADLKTMIANGVFGMSAITALTAQNTTGVTDVLEVSPEFLSAQIDAVFDDIRPDAVKIGMVASTALIDTIADRLSAHGAMHVVLDPVMVATSGARLIDESAICALTAKLFPLAEVVTPNIPEAEVLAEMTIACAEDMITAAKRISERYGCAVLCKGGHQLNDANDLFYADGRHRWFEGRRIDNPNTHGTGCTLSSAIASNLAKGHTLTDSVERAKRYVSGALADQLDLGKGRGPMNHGFALTVQPAR